MVDDERARDGIEHLQAAARELIAAARSMLDVAEDLVDDPGAVQEVVDVIGQAARSALRGAGFKVPGTGGNEGEGNGVERIEVT